MIKATSTRGRHLPILLGLIGSVSQSGEAIAEQPTQAQIAAIRSSCQSDYRANCAGIPPGGRAALACLQQNLSKLSPACQAAVSAASEGASAAPAPAAEQPSAVPAPAAAPAPAPAPAPAAPVVAPSPAPAPSATTYPPISARQEITILRQACGPDYRIFCGGIPPGGGRVIACLRENGPSLSLRCRRTLLRGLPR
jgi:hypothetical protein